ncbi:MAG TPA: hypothetical protein ENI65_05950 [Gammaproteobacteria bacterium]|nr:hypothetical protein [Gammaproteobacteria bacterium]
MNKTLYCAISFHGYGHIAQTIPVLEKLNEVRPDVRLVIQCAAPRALLDAGLEFGFEHIEVETDFGMVMKNALDVDIEASHRRYSSVHKDWDTTIKRAAGLLESVRPAAVFSNISYTVNAAADRLSIPVINMCSLSWVDIYKAYCAHYPGATGIIGQMKEAYNKAEVFLGLTPGMPMTELANVRKIATVARTGVDRSGWIREKTGLASSARLVLISYGGVGLPMDFNCWPRLEDVIYIVASKDITTREDFISIESVGVNYIDILASCDVVITKPGYGMFAESACNGIPVLYTRRPGWPEESYLVEWLKANAVCDELSRDDLQGGNISEAVQGVMSRERHNIVRAEGTMQAVDELCRLLD